MLSRRLWPVLLLVPACRVDPTQLVVVVATDMGSDELDRIRLRVFDSDGGAHGEHDLEIGDGGITLPATFGVAPLDRDSSRKVTVSVDAMHGNDLQFETHALTGFIEHERLRLDLFLAHRCITEASTCDAHQTCLRGGCVDENFPAKSLEHWDPDAPLEPDAGVPDEDWVHVLEGPQAVLVTNTVVDEDGDVYVAGHFQRAMRLDDGPLEPTVSGADNVSDTWVARFDGASGDLVWLRTFGGEDSTYPWALAASAEHGVVVAGSALAQIEIDGVPQGYGGASAFAVRLASTDGAVLSVQSLSSSGWITIEDVTFTAAGAVDAVGTFGDDLSWGWDAEVELATVGGAQNGFRLRLASDGDVPPTCVLALQDSTPMSGLAPLEDGRIAVAGTFSGSLVLGQGPDLQRTAEVGERNLYVTRMDCDVAEDLAVVRGYVMSALIARAGTSLVVVGGASGDLVEPFSPAVGSTDLFAAVIAEDASVTTAWVDGSDADDLYSDVAPSSSSDVLVSAVLNGPMSPESQSGGLVVRIDTTGAVTTVYETPAGNWAVARSTFPGRIVASGSLLGTIHFGELGDRAVTEGNVGGTYIYSFVP